MGCITDGDVQSGPDGGKDTGGGSPFGFSETLIVGLYGAVGGDRCEESSDEGQADSGDGIAGQVSVHALADVMEVFGRHSWWLFCSFECLRIDGWRREVGGKGDDGEKK